MNPIDVLLFGVIAVSVWLGILKGFLAESIQLITWLGSLMLCVLIYPYVSHFIERNILPDSLWVLPLSFVLTILIIRIFFSLIFDRLFYKIPEEYHIRRINKVLGALPGLVNGLVYSTVITGILLLFPLGPGIKTLTQESPLAEKFSAQLEKLQVFLTPVIEDVGQRSYKKVIIDPSEKEFIRLGFTVKKARVRPDLEVAMLRMINEERKRKGLPALKADPDLTKVARFHSMDMFRRGYFSHYTPDKKDPFDRIRESKIPFITAGENLALAPTLKLAHRNLMNSPGHRANILHPSFGRVGIGVLDGGIYGLMITQNFRN